MVLPFPRWRPTLLALAVAWIQIPALAQTQQSSDVPLPQPDIEQVYRDSSGLQQVVGDSAIPPVRDRQFGPRIQVTAIRLDQLPEFPDKGITRDVLAPLVEKLRRQYSREDELVAGGFTLSELKELAEQLQQMGARDNPEAVTGAGADQLAATLRKQQQQRGLSYGDLEEIANQVTRFYRERGVILAKAYIPAQTVKDGVVALSVLEGRLGNIVVQGNKRYDEKQLTEVFEAQRGKAVDSAAVEESMYLLNDLPGLNAYGFFSAGTTPGTTDLTLQARKEQPYRLTLSGDNYGSRFTGDERLFVLGEWLNPLGIGDQLAVGWLQSRSPVNSELGMIDYNLPLSVRTRVGISYDHNNFSLDDSDPALALLDITGTNTNLALSVIHKLLRGRGNSIDIGAALTDKETTLEATVDIPNGEEHVRGLDLSTNISVLSDRWRLLNMAVMHLSYGQFESEVDPLRGDDFYKFALDTSSLKFAQLPFTEYDTRLLLRSRWQYSESALPAFEQLSIGGAHGVRAFAVSDFSADQAAMLALEWYWPLPSSWDVSFAGTTLNNLLQIGLFTDAAYGVQNAYQLDESDKWSYLSAYGVVFKLNWRGVSAEASFALPESSQSSLDNIGEDADSLQTYVNFTWVMP